MKASNSEGIGSMDYKKMTLERKGEVTSMPFPLEAAGIRDFQTKEGREKRGKLSKG